MESIFPLPASTTQIKTYPSPRTKTDSPGTAARCSATAGATPEGTCAPAYDPSGEDGDADERRDDHSARTAEPAGREAKQSLPSAGASLPFPAKGTRSAGDVADDVDAAYARRNALSAPAAEGARRMLPPAPQPGLGTRAPPTTARRTGHIPPFLSDRDVGLQDDPSRQEFGGGAGR